MVTIKDEPGFPAYGSADVNIRGVSACGRASKPVRYVICDNELSPGQEGFATSAGPGPFQGNDELAFTWNRPASYKGHAYEMEYYDNYFPNSHQEIKGGFFDDYQGFNQESTLTATELLNKAFVNKNMVVFRQHSMNRCRIAGEYGKYVVYRKQDCVVNKYNTPLCKEIVRDHIFDWPAFIKKWNGNWPEEFKVIKRIVNVETTNPDLDGKSVVIDETVDGETTVISNVITETTETDENGNVKDIVTETKIVDVDGKIEEIVDTDATVSNEDGDVVEIEKVSEVTIEP